jgi:hypothetical protein
MLYKFFLNPWLADLWSIVHIRVLYNECIKLYNWFQTFCTRKSWFPYAITCSLGQSHEKINHMKISKSWDFETKVCKRNDSFIKQFD